VLFSGEEQGEAGSKLYVSEHKRELPGISAILVNDTGTGRIVTVGVHENYNDIGPLQEILAPVASQLRLLEPKLSRTFGSDYAPFNAAGVPGFSCIGDAPEYSETQHTQSDTFDKASEPGLIESAQLMAVWAFNTAQYPSLLPRRAGK
jgi:Zn-dependent M28 family amino/carboxypeptidase